MASKNNQLLLFGAIESCTLERLRTVLSVLCNKSPHGFRIACDELLVEQCVLRETRKNTKQSERDKDGFGEKYNRDINSDGEPLEIPRNLLENALSESEYSSAESDIDSGANLNAAVREMRKRAYTRQRYEICGQCDEEYDVLSNRDTSCRWHSVFDDDASIWDDWDVPTWGQPDTEDNRVEYPQGFKWIAARDLAAEKIVEGVYIILVGLNGPGYPIELLS
ncbi:hypothetical protein BDV96DRAFT_666165 [Lophiotrema nucula]|uniref:Uncharacterized protein n=1 Tax=Lophiotrema nucula TaxID=690887 RepID=A0A6A5YWJ4_9PLEO|nr:hypothetical protein BDV96DRAFT_666165 [Lophiotrema nucula]